MNESNQKQSQWPASIFKTAWIRKAKIESIQIVIFKVSFLMVSVNFILQSIVHKAFCPFLKDKK